MTSEPVPEPTRTDYIAGGSRCAVRKSVNLPEWWVGTSPRNGDGACVEGPWEDWVVLAREILRVHKIEVGDE